MARRISASPIPRAGPGDAEADNPHQKRQHERRLHHAPDDAVRTAGHGLPDQEEGGVIPDPGQRQRRQRLPGGPVRWKTEENRDAHGQRPDGGETLNEVQVQVLVGGAAGDDAENHPEQAGEEEKEKRCNHVVPAFIKLWHVHTIRCARLFVNGGFSKKHAETCKSAGCKSNRRRAGDCRRRCLTDRSYCMGTFLASAVTVHASTMAQIQETIPAYPQVHTVMSSWMIPLLVYPA